MTAAPEGPDVLYDVSDGVATITLNRPSVMNATTPVMLSRYFAALRRADADPEVRAAVVTGAGKCFCAGADLDWLAGADGADDAEDPEGESPDRALDLSIPVIGAINGAAVGSGFSLMLMTDIRFVAAGAKLIAPFARLGLVAEYGTSWLLPRLIGTANALDLLMSGRTVKAEEALSLGLVQHVLPVDEVLPAATAYARDLAAYCSPTSMATIRSQVYGDLSRDRPEAVARSVRLMLESFKGDDLAEAMAAHQENRPPRFGPLRPSP